MKKETQDITVYDVIDKNDKKLMKLLDYVSNNFYGAAYAVLDKSNNLYGFNIDGQIYELRDPEFAKKMGRKLFEIRKAVDDFNELMKKERNITDHFSNNHIKNHPRWIFSRREMGFVKNTDEFKNEYVCPIMGEKKSIQFWINFVLLANGNSIIISDNINLDELVSFKEFSERLPHILLLQDQRYMGILVNTFIGTYKKVHNTSIDFGPLSTAVKVLIESKERNEEYEALKDDIYKALRKIDDRVRYECEKSIGPIFYHSDLIQFMDLSIYLDGHEKRLSVELDEFGFPLAVHRGQCYDFRSKTQVARLKSQICKEQKVNSNKANVKVKKKRKK